MGVRVFQLARELDMSSKDLLAYLKTQGLKAKSHMSSLDDTVAQILRERLPKKLQGQKKKEDEVKKPGEGNGSAEAAKSTSDARSAGKVRRGGESTEAARSDGRDGRRDVKARADDSPGDDGEPKKKTPARKRVFFSDMPSTSTRRPSRGPRPRHRDGPGGGSRVAPPTPKVTEAEIQLPITIKELSSTIGLKVSELMTALLKKGHMLSMNAYVDDALIQFVGESFGITITVKKEQTTEDAILELEAYESDTASLLQRAPVVTFLGHVDHGKTSLLDFIRKTKVTSREHGGITQHMGAYRVDSGDVHVVFIDTPGHKAFTEMRSRGANVTDVAVLVVAADEGVMPQTEEAYNHAKAAGVPIVVALNKIDRPTANVQKCYEQLSRLGLMPVQWNGDTEMIEVSAHSGQGINELLETLSLESQILELKADPTRPAIGTVLEAESNPGRGILVTILVQDGTLHVGDYVLCGHAHGRIRNMWLNGTEPVKEAAPSTPVQISGLSALPEAGERFYVFEDAQRARSIAAERHLHRREEDRAKSQKLSLESIWEKFGESKENELRLIIKADVKGTLQALETTLEELSTAEVKIKVLHCGVGAVGQDDILLADASDAIVLAFNVAVDDRARSSAEEKQVEIRTYKVIYEAVDDIRRALEDRLAPILKEVSQGFVEIRKVYKASRIGNIAGCFVRKGMIARDSKVRLLRDDKVIHEGTLDSLKRFKDDAKEVKEGFECGLKIAGYDGIQEGDVVEAFTIVKEKRSL